MDTTIVHLLTQLFPRDAVLDWARSVGAVRRLRDIHPADLVCALVSGAMGDEERSIATIRRMFDRIAGFMPEESSFYTRFNEGLASLMRLLWLRALSFANRAQRKRLARVLGVKVKDLRVVDATQASLPSWARDEFPSTHKVLGGFKLTATMSLLDELLVSAHLTDARRHDRKAFELPEDIQGVLYLFHRGYCDHRLFQQIAKSGGFFLGRLKSSSVPRLMRVRSGLGKAHTGERLDSFLPHRGIVDVERRVQHRQRAHGHLPRGLDPGAAARRWAHAHDLRRPCHQPLRVAVLRRRHRRDVPPEVCRGDALQDLEDRGTLGPAPIGKSTGHRGVRVRRPAPHHTGALRLRGHARETARYRTQPSPCGPSHSRLPATFLRRVGHEGLLEVVEQFINALWREGRNPNPGRRYATSRHIVSVEKFR